MCFFFSLQEVNTEICEQLFSWLSKYAPITKHMNRWRFLFLIIYILDCHNESTLQCWNFTVLNVTTCLLELCVVKRQWVGLEKLRIFISSMEEIGTKLWQKLNNEQNMGYCHQATRLLQILLLLMLRFQKITNSLPMQIEKGSVCNKFCIYKVRR